MVEALGLFRDPSAVSALAEVVDGVFPEPVRVEAVTKASKIYHAGAARQRVDGRNDRTEAVAIILLTPERPQGERLTLVDLGSTYGTRVNDAVTIQRELNDGDAVTVLGDGPPGPLGILDGGRAEVDPRTAGGERGAQRLLVTDPPADLDREIGKGLGDAPHRLGIDRPAGKGAVQIDHVQAPRPGIDPALGDLQRILGEDRVILHDALAQAYAFAVFQIDSGDNQHFPVRSRDMEIHFAEKLLPEHPRLKIDLRHPQLSRCAAALLHPARRSGSGWYWG